MAKGRKLPTSRSEILLGSYGYNNQCQGTVNDCSELAEDEVWSVEWSSRAAEESHRHEYGHAGGLPPFVYGDLRDTSPQRIMPHGQDSMAQPTRGSRHVANSAPVNVPDWSKIYRVNSVESMHDWESDNFVEKDSKLVPPHEYLARESARCRKLAANSVFEGAGRTLKGRDMSRVRDAVWSQTGFNG